MRRIPGLAAILFLLTSTASAQSDWTLIGWNNLGMHCMDADYSVFALLPPFNTIHAQLIRPNGSLVTEADGIVVTYEAVADPTGSINSTSAGKSNFWEHAESLFGVTLDADVGLAGAAMPGAANTPQPMAFDATRQWFVADGIPITPRDDAGAVHRYPLMRLVARDAVGGVLASTDIVLPVSDEMSCAACHASHSDPASEPPSGWVEADDPERDYRLNILRLHDDLEGWRLSFQEALAQAGYNPRGLYATVIDDGGAVLCARCHSFEALPGSGIAGIPPLTQAIHRRMASARDPLTGTALGADDNRSACYRCHPGSTTRCLRGAMGSAVAADGSQAMQCQSCHGSMLDVASRDRVGWLDEPNCQSCHTGTATQNAGAIRFTSVFDESGAVRRPAVDVFATNADTPAPGYALFRFSTGHGGLACSACHGSTHAIFPSSHDNDNLQSRALQNHEGTLAECTACHATAPDTVDGGPHGMHPVGAVWVERHDGAAERLGVQTCRPCHGSDDRGTELSRSHADRSLNTKFGTKNFWRGFQIGCYTCHRGPRDDDANRNRAPVVQDAAAATRQPSHVDIALAATDADGDALELRIVQQAKHGRVGLQGRTARYFPDPGFAGDDTFRFAASDGQTDSNLATARVAVAASPCGGDCDGGGSVTVDEIVRGVSIALGVLPLSECTPFDLDADATVTVDELVRAVTAALQGC